MDNYYIKYNLSENELVIEFYQTKEDCDYILKHAFNVSELKQIVQILESNIDEIDKSNIESNIESNGELNSDWESLKIDSGEIYNNRILKELYILVSNNILTIGVCHGGPRIKIKVLPYLYSVFKKSIIKLRE